MFLKFPFFEGCVEKHTLPVLKGIINILVAEEVAKIPAIKAEGPKKLQLLGGMRHNTTFYKLLFFQNFKFDIWQLCSLMSYKFTKYLF